MLNTFEDNAAGQRLGFAILNTLPEPFLVLDSQFSVLTASRHFYETFKTNATKTIGVPLYDLAGGQFDLPPLRAALATIIPQHTAIDGFEIACDLPEAGRRVLLLNARSVRYEDGANTSILLAFTDITARRAVERDKAALLARTEELLRQKQVLLQEMEHRVANSLQIIASILLLKARGVTSEETRLHLRDAHQRVMSVAAVQRQLHASEGIDQIEVGTYLTNLCASLAASMIGESQSIKIEVVADKGMIESGKAVSLGLIVTELLINAIKYAFPADKPDALILVTYEVQDTAWRLTVSDNGVGTADLPTGPAEGGLGTALVSALAKQLEAETVHASSPAGLSIALTHATFRSHMPKAN